jgi:hypothetical protein
MTPSTLATGAATGQTHITADDHAIPLNRITEIIAETLDDPPLRIRLPLFVLNAASVAGEFACRPVGLRTPHHRRRTSWFAATRSFDTAKGVGPLRAD